MTDQDREAFEAHARSRGGDDCNFTRDADGNYTGYKTAATWRTWLAARDHYTEQHRELVEAVEERSAALLHQVNVYKATRPDEWEKQTEANRRVGIVTTKVLNAASTLAAKHKEMLDV